MRTPEQAIRNFSYFCMNYDYKFIEKCWKDEPIIVEHLRDKFNDFYNLYGSSAVMIKFMIELDGQRQRELAAWIDENYNEIKDEKYVLYASWGKKNSRVLYDPNERLLYPSEYEGALSDVEKLEFDTPAEGLAFIQGAEASSGWEEHWIMSPEEFDEVKRNKPTTDDPED